MTDSPWWWAVPAAALSFAAILGFVPGFLLRLLVLLYPHDDPRRRELVAELYVLGRMERMEWVFQQLETALFEGIAARLERRRSRGEADESADEKTERRRFLAYAAAVALSPGPFGSPTGSPASQQVLHSGSRIRMNEVRHMEAAARALRLLNDQYGGGLCRDAVVAQLSRAERMLSTSGSEAVKRRLHVAVADLHDLAGWASFELGLIDSARSHFGRALVLAKAGNSNQLVVSVLCRMGRLYLRQNAPDDVLKMFQLSKIVAQESIFELPVAVISADDVWAYMTPGTVARDPAEAWTAFIESIPENLRGGECGPAPRTDADPR